MLINRTILWIKLVRVVAVDMITVERRVEIVDMMSEIRCRNDVRNKVQI